MYTIYSLIDPRNHTTRYVGITVDVYQRFKQHIRCDGCNPEKDAWIQELKEKQLLVIMQSLEQVETLEEALRQEQYWIKHYSRLGVLLTNSAVTGVKVKRIQQVKAKVKNIPSRKDIERKHGKGRGTVETIELLTQVHASNGEWPDDVYISEKMKGYFRRKYPEFFTFGSNRAAERLRNEHQRMAETVKADRIRRGR